MISKNILFGAFFTLYYLASHPVSAAHFLDEEEYHIRACSFYRDQNYQAQALISRGDACGGELHIRDRAANGEKNLYTQMLISLVNARKRNQRAYYSEALDVLGPKGDRYLRAQALIGLSNACEGRQSIYYCNEALKVIGPNGDTYLRAKALISLGNACEGRQSRSYYREALKVIGPNGDTYLRAKALSCLGDAYCKDSQTLKGVKYYCQACKLGDQEARAKAAVKETRVIRELRQESYKDISLSEKEAILYLFSNDVFAHLESKSRIKR